MRSKIVKRKSKSTPIVQLACYKKKRISPTGQTGLALQRLPTGGTNGAIACSVVKRKAFFSGRVPVISAIDNKNKKQAKPIVQLACYKEKRISPTGQKGLALQRLQVRDAEGAIACSVAKRSAFSSGRVPRYLHHRQQK